MKRSNAANINTCAKYRKCNSPISTKFDNFVSSLLNLSAKIVAENIPYELIEKRDPPIPDQLQKKIIYYSFPRKEQDIYIYSSYGLPEKTSDANKKLSFYQGVSLIEKNMVHNIMQIGFHLNGVVQDNHRSNIISRKNETAQAYNVSVTFDRCKITSVHCTCSHQGLFWCPHIVALALYRIRKPEAVQFREPISESLVRMDRDQLQKFAQYLIASHPNQVLSSAQNLVDQLLETDSTINQIYGAPDPTAGAGVSQPEPQWHLNENQIREQVNHQLASLSVSEIPGSLSAMCVKVREMLRVQDSNGARMLALMTDQCLKDNRLSIFKMRQAEMWPAYRDLWEELSQLWICVVLCPWISSTDRQKWKQKLIEWSQHDCCPPEDWDYGRLLSGPFNRVSDLEDEHLPLVANIEIRNLRPNGVFRLALIASDMSWDLPHLQDIMNNKHGTSHAWSEQLPLSCLRVLALRTNGLQNEAVNLALSISRFLIAQRAHLLSSSRINKPIEEPLTPLAQTFSLDSHSLAPDLKLSNLTSFNCLIKKYSSCVDDVDHPADPDVLNPDSFEKTFTLHNTLLTQQQSSSTESDVSSPLPNAFITTVQLSRSTSLNSSSNCFRLSKPAITTSNPDAIVNSNSLLSQTATSITNQILPGFGWFSIVGNPIKILVECLLEVCRSDSGTTRHPQSLSNNVKSTPPTSLSHVKIENSDDLPDRSFLNLALRIAILSLCQERIMPSDKHKQERCLNQESRLLDLLSSLPKYDPELSFTLVQCIQAELNCLNGSSLSPNLVPNSYPMHATANFFFKWILSFNQDLAYSLVRRAMRLPILENHSDQHSDEQLLLPPPPYHRGNDSVRPQFQLSEMQLLPNPTPLLQTPLTNPPLVTVTAGGRWPVLRRVESTQCELALTMVQAARDSSQRLDEVLKICDRHIHSSTSLFKLSQDICSKCFMNAHLRCAVFHLSLNVASRTLRRSHWRRREMVQWLISCAVPVGTVGILHLVSHWRHYITPKEAVLQVATTLLGPTRVIVDSHQTSNGQGSVTQDERVRREVRKMALEAASKDPLHCGMRALSLSEKDHHMFEATYQAIYDAAERGSIGPAELFSLGRYLEPRSNRRKAYALALFAINYLQPVEVQDVCPLATDHDISWACMLSHGLGTEALSEMIGQIVRKVRAPLLLADILHRCRLSPIVAHPPHDRSDQSRRANLSHHSRTLDSSSNNSYKVFLTVSESPLQLLLNAAVEAFFTSTQLRLANISPRHYNDFLEFLCKAREVFLLIVPGGVCKFKQLIDSIRQSHRGKRKLNSLLKERFLFDASAQSRTEML